MSEATISPLQIDQATFPTISTEVETDSKGLKPDNQSDSLSPVVELNAYKG